MGLDTDTGLFVFHDAGAQGKILAFAKTDWQIGTIRLKAKLAAQPQKV